MGSYVPNTLEERKEMLKVLSRICSHIFLMRLRSKSD